MQSIRQILAYTKNLNRLFAIIAVVSVLGALLTLVTPIVIKFATDWLAGILQGHHSFDWSTLGVFGAIIIGNSLLSTLIGDVGGYFGDQLSVRSRAQLSSLYFEHLLKLPQKYYDNESTGKIINRLSRAVTDITNFLQFFSNSLLQTILIVVVTIAILLWYSWPIALLFVLLIPANLYLTARTSGPWQKIEKQKNKYFDLASGRFAEVMSQMRLVKSYNSGARELSDFRKNINKLIPLTSKQSIHWHKMNALRSIVYGFIYGFILLILFYLTAKKQITLGDMTMLLTLVAQVNFPLRNLSFFVDNYQRAVANSRDYIEAMNETPETDDSDKPELVVNGGMIEYRDVDFAYSSGDKQVLYRVNFKVEPNTKVALVGESGGGKSTIVNLLMNLYSPSAGQVLIDDQDVARHSSQSLRQTIATVFQDPAMFSGSIRDNIAYAKPTASMEEIERSAKIANAHEFIMKFQKGYDAEIGERGIKLSGGQKQRLSIARAVLKNAPILILDEATSSLDSKSEHEVQMALERLMKNRTTLIIAHRLSTIADVDKIVTLKDGRIDEIGKPNELASTDGIYANLLKLQLGATESARKRLQKFDIVE